jgi:hypothetical protein
MIKVGPFVCWVGLVANKQTKIGSETPSWLQKEIIVNRKQGFPRCLRHHLSGRITISGQKHVRSPFEIGGLRSYSLDSRRSKLHLHLDVHADPWTFSTGKTH